MSELEKVVLNQCHGHFGLSRAAFLRLRDLGNSTALNEPDYGEVWPDDPRSIRERYLGDQFCVSIPRNDPQLIQVIMEMGQTANGMDADLQIVEVTTPYVIEEDDGKERAKSI